MRLPIQRRLTLSFLSVLLLGVCVAIGLTWTTIEKLYLDTQKDNLVAQARLTAAAIESTELPFTLNQPYLQTSNVMPGVHTRLLSESGAVILASAELFQDQSQPVPIAENVGFVSPENLLERSEIQAALQGLTETAIRNVDSAGGARVLYAAAPIWDEGQNVSGIVYLATPIPHTGLPADLLLKMIAIVLLAIVLSSLAGTYLARMIAQPIKALDRAAIAVSSGELSQVVSIKSISGELDRLSESFNHMVNSLHQSEQVKNAFIADVTHELRTPLTVIKGTVETLEDGAMDDLEGRGPLLAAMEKETDRLIRLVNQLLILTRVDSCALQIKPQPLDLAVLSRSRCQQLAPLAEERKVMLAVHPKDKEVGFWVNGDEDRLAQVLDNLLDNAIRHSPSGSRVRINLQRESNKILCEVVDQGPGIPEEHLPHLFDRFYRVESSRDRQTGGTGLGLAIVRALVKAHKGKVAAESTEGEGCKISFWLPAIEPP